MPRRYPASQSGASSACYEPRGHGARSVLGCVVVIGACPGWAMILATPSASCRPRGTGRSDRAQLERLCRYVTRPPLAQDRLQLRSDGRLELTLKNIWRDALFDAAASDGAAVRAMIFEPHDLLATSRGRSATSEFSFVEVLRRSFGGTPRSAARATSNSSVRPVTRFFA